jgi:hypothetical protein
MTFWPIVRGLDLGRLVPGSAFVPFSFHQGCFLMGRKAVGAVFICQEFRHVPRMSLASKPKKVKQKGALRELKIVQSVSRRGADIVATEEVKTPRRVASPKASSTQRNQSSSPAKRRKLDGWDEQPIPCHLEGHEEHQERQTLVFLQLDDSLHVLTI